MPRLTRAGQASDAPLAYIDRVLAALLAAVLAQPTADAGAALAALDVRERNLMTTTVTVALRGGDARSREAAFAQAFSVFEAVDADLNEWRPASALGRVNKGAGGPAVQVHPELCEVVGLALDGARRTGGLFDPSWAALRDLWRFDRRPKVPSSAALKARCGLVAWKEVELAPLDAGAGCTLRLPRKGMALGLGGIAKGWGVDRAVAALRALGFRDFYVHAGGDLYLAGRNGDRPWRAGIRDPRGPPEQTFAMLEVQDAAFSTTGDYERFYVVDGRRYHHVIDPRTCRPSPISRSVTVLARSATDAEVLTKAAFILGGPEGLALAESFGAQAVIVDAANTVHVSKALEGRLQLSGPAPDPARRAP